MNTNILIQMLIFFLSIAPFTIAGAQTLIPELYRHFVQNTALLTPKEFTTVVALAQIAPGPNMLVISLLGWRVAGLSGLLVATGALLGPTCLATWFVARWINRLKDAKWLTIVKVSLAPVVIGLMLSSGSITSRAANHDVIGWGLTAVTSVFIYFTSRNPLWVLGAGAATGVLAHRLGLMQLAP